MTEPQPALLVFATRNPGKVAELRVLLADSGIQVRSLAELEASGLAIPEVVEDGETFADNAAKKARAVSTATGLPALADDSGLEVDALDGAPGVYSARYAGPSASDEDNNDKLLEALRDVPEAGRSARFRSVLAFADSAGPLGAECVTATGTCEGLILKARRGTGGFGYDPLFYSPELHSTFAEVDTGAKNDASHRARAMAAMKPQLLRYFRLASSNISG